MATFASTYTVSSTYSTYTGHSNSSGAGLRDGAGTGGESVWGSAGTGVNWIQADIGSSVTINTVSLRSIDAAFDGWGAYYTNGAKIQYSPDGTNWTDSITISGVVDGTQSNFTINQTARYVRILANPTNYVGVGDFSIDYTASAPAPNRRNSSRALVFPN